MWGNLTSHVLASTSIRGNPIDSRRLPYEPDHRTQSQEQKWQEPRKEPSRRRLTRRGEPDDHRETADEVHDEVAVDRLPHRLRALASRRPSLRRSKSQRAN